MKRQLALDYLCCYGRSRGHQADIILHSTIRPAWSSTRIQCVTLLPCRKARRPAPSHAQGPTSLGGKPADARCATTMELPAHYPRSGRASEARLTRADFLDGDAFCSISRLFPGIAPIADLDRKRASNHAGQSSVAPDRSKPRGQGPLAWFSLPGYNTCSGDRSPSHANEPRLPILPTYRTSCHAGSRS